MNILTTSTSQNKLIIKGLNLVLVKLVAIKKHNNTSILSAYFKEQSKLVNDLLKKYSTVLEEQFNRTEIKTMLIAINELQLQYHNQNKDILSLQNKLIEAYNNIRETNRWSRVLFVTKTDTIDHHIGFNHSNFNKEVYGSSAS